MKSHFITCFNFSSEKNTLIVGNKINVRFTYLLEWSLKM